MLNNKLELLKSYEFDKRETHNRDDSEGTWSATENVTALHTYSYRGNAYIVLTVWYYSGEGDMADSDHYRSLSFRVYPIDLADAESEERVRQIMSGTEGFESHAGGYPNIDIRTEDSFTRYISDKVKGAIDEYHAVKKKTEAISSGQEILPNVVKVYYRDTPNTEVIYDFGSHAGLGQAFYRCTSVSIHELEIHPDCKSPIDRPLCYYYPADYGKISVCIVPDFFNPAPVLVVARSSKFQPGNSAVICAYVDGKPAPLTPDEVQKLMDFANR